MSRLRAPALLLAALMLLVGCADRREAREWLSRAEAAHRDADRHLGRGDADGARDVLLGAASTPAPSFAVPGDVRAVRQDLYARLAAVDVGRGRAREAAAWATTGLELGRARDVFTANLLILRGRAMEQVGDASAASRDYHDALLVTEALLDESLRGPSRTP
jgi:hypothetical protein